MNKYFQKTASVEQRVQSFLQKTPQALEMDLCFLARNHLIEDIGHMACAIEGLPWSFFQIRLDRSIAAPSKAHALAAPLMALNKDTEAKEIPHSIFHAKSKQYAEVARRYNKLGQESLLRYCQAFLNHERRIRDGQKENSTVHVEELQDTFAVFAHVAASHNDAELFKLAHQLYGQEDLSYVQFEEKFNSQTYQTNPAFAALANASESVLELFDTQSLLVACRNEFYEDVNPLSLIAQKQGGHLFPAQVQHMIRAMGDVENVDHLMPSHVDWLNDAGLKFFAQQEGDALQEMLAQYPTLQRHIRADAIQQAYAHAMNAHGLERDDFHWDKHADAYVQQALKHTFQKDLQHAHSGELFLIACRLLCTLLQMQAENIEPKLTALGASQGEVLYNLAQHNMVMCIQWCLDHGYGPDASHLGEPWIKGCGDQDARQAMQAILNRAHASALAENLRYSPAPTTNLCCPTFGSIPIPELP